MFKPTLVLTETTVSSKLPILGGLQTNCQMSNYFCMFGGICLLIHEEALCSYGAEM